jgi:hypothetical protein
VSGGSARMGLVTASPPGGALAAAVARARARAAPQTCMRMDGCRCTSSGTCRSGRWRTSRAARVHERAGPGRGSLRRRRGQARNVTPKRSGFRAPWPRHPALP